MAIRWMYDYQVVELTGVPEPDEATLNPFGLIGSALVAATPVAATGRLVASLTRGTLHCNLQVPLWQLVRASTAAPVFFPPEVIQWDKNDPTKSFVFVDGGVTPYNNPAFLLYRMATQEPYRLCWQTGERKQLLISVGTGAAPTLGSAVSASGSNLVTNLTGLPGNLMYGAQVDQDINCRTVGRCTYGALLDRELADLIPRQGGCDFPTLEAWLAAPPIPLATDLGRAFLYARYNADLSEAGLQALGCGHMDPDEVQKLDSVESMNDLTEIGRAAAKAVNLAHFGPFV
jgi:uncharacterized protein